MSEENELKTSASAGPLDAQSPTESPTGVPALSFDREAFLLTPASSPWLSDSACFVYIMTCDRFVKVGITTDVRKRLAGLQGANPFPVTLAKKYKFSTKKYAGLAERTCHAVFAPHQVYGEWFDLPYEVAEPMVTTIVQATRELTPVHRKQITAAKAAQRERYETDPAYRGKIDRDYERSARAVEQFKQRERARELADREFDRQWYAQPGR